MKTIEISMEIRRSYQERAHLERSLAFHQSLRQIGFSVKNLLSQPERIIHKTAKKMRQTRNHKSDAMLMHARCRQ